MKTIVIDGGTEHMYLNCDGKRYAVTGNTVTIRLENPKLWSPENPYLYRFTLTSDNDEVKSYFALLLTYNKYGRAFVYIG